MSKPQLIAEANRLEVSRTGKPDFNFPRLIGH